MGKLNQGKYSECEAFIFLHRLEKDTMSSVCRLLHAFIYFEIEEGGSGSDIARNTTLNERFSSANSTAAVLSLRG